MRFEHVICTRSFRTRGLYTTPVHHDLYTRLHATLVNVACTHVLYTCPVHVVCTHDLTPRPVHTALYTLPCTHGLVHTALYTRPCTHDLVQTTCTHGLSTPRSVDHGSTRGLYTMVCNHDLYTMVCICGLYTQP